MNLQRNRELRIKIDIEMGGGVVGIFFP